MCPPGILPGIDDLAAAVDVAVLQRNIYFKEF